MHNQEEIISNREYPRKIVSFHYLPKLYYRRDPLQTEKINHRSSSKYLHHRIDQEYKNRSQHDRCSFSSSLENTKVKVTSKSSILTFDR